MARSWNISDIPSQTGCSAVVTGANSGVGFHVAEELACKGATVILACRSRERGEEAAQQIRKRHPETSVSCEVLDLADLRSVHEFARSYLASGRPLHLLINNAGVMALPKRQKTADGFEMQFGTNVLGPFALTGLLFPLLEASSRDRNSVACGLRVVNVASIAHLQGHIHLNDLQSEASYSPWAAYRQSKLADLMLSLELNRRLQDCASPVMSVAAHPGVAKSNLMLRDAPAHEQPVRKVINHLIGVFLNSAAEGALPILYAATSDDAKPGGYYGPTGFREMRGAVGDAQIANRAHNRTTASALWQLCEQLVGLRYP